jgi:hypothetical protein
MNRRDEPVACETCGSGETGRRVSRVRMVRSEDQIMESMADPSMLSGLDENDPRSIARWAKKMAKEMGEDIGDEIEAMAEEELAKGPGGMADGEPGVSDPMGAGLAPGSGCGPTGCDPVGGFDEE